MKIQYCSDLHLEFKNNAAYLAENPIKPLGEILLLAGDILPIPLMNTAQPVLDYLSREFEAVYWIPGNHEYYRSDIYEVKDGRLVEIRPNVYFGNNFIIQHKGVDIICSTMWSKISPQHALEISQFVSDFYLISVRGERLTTGIFNTMHRHDLNFIQQSLIKSEAATKIVMTHHVPTLMHYPEPFKFSSVNEAFAVELFDFIETCNADYWIYGHHHTNNADFKIGKTMMLTNQLGYVNQGQHFRYRNGTVIEI